MPGPISLKNMLKGAVAANSDGGRWWRSGQYAAAYQAEEDVKSGGYPRPSREDGYYSESDGSGKRVGQFIGRDGKITAERPHVHVVHNEREGRIIFTVTQRSGKHSSTEYLPINASGNQVNAVIRRLTRELR